MDVNVIHGIILLIRAITVRREFFNEKYKTERDFCISAIIEELKK